MAIDQRVIVTYSAPSTFLQSDSWQQFFPTLKAQLPLHNLHWKSASRPSIRTIQELQIDLVPLEAAKDEPASQIPTTLLERPLLNVYVVICEVSLCPYDTYIMLTLDAIRMPKPTNLAYESNSRTGIPPLAPGNIRIGSSSICYDLTHGRPLLVSSPSGHQCLTRLRLTSTQTSVIGIKPTVPIFRSYKLTGSSDVSNCHGRKVKITQLPGQRP